MAIPPFEMSGNLPPGIHFARWEEVAARFGGNPRRDWLLGGLLRALRNLRAAGCGTAYLDGSFVTAIATPEDFDACWDTAGVDLRSLDPVLKSFEPGRLLQKAKYLGELFPAGSRANSAGKVFLEFFQEDKSTGNAKGIVAIRLHGLPK